VAWESTVTPPPPTAPDPTLTPEGRVSGDRELPPPSPSPFTLGDLKFRLVVATRVMGAGRPARVSGDRYLAFMAAAAAGRSGQVKVRTGVEREALAPTFTPVGAPVRGSRVTMRGLRRGTVMSMGEDSPETLRGVAVVGESRDTVVTRVSLVRLGRRSWELLGWG
jgi:hypothetical protein